MLLLLLIWEGRRDTPGKGCCHVNSAAEAADGERAFAVRALRGALPFSPLFSRDPCLCLALIFAEASCPPAAVHAGAVENRAVPEGGHFECGSSGHGEPIGVV